MIPLKCFKRQIENDSSLKISNLASSCCNLNSSWEPRRDEEWLVDALIFWRSLLIVLYFFSPLAIWSLIFKHWFIIWFGCMVWGLFLAPVHRMKNRTREGMIGWRYKLESIRKADPTLVSTVAPSTVVVAHKNPTPQREVIQSSEAKGGTSSTNKDRTQIRLNVFPVQG